MTNSTADLLEQAIALLSEVARGGVLSLSDDELCEAVRLTERAGRFLDASRVAGAAEVEERSRFELGRDGLAYRLGHRRGIHAVESLTLVSQAESSRRVKLGTALRPRLGLGGEQLPPLFPHVAEAVASGAMGIDAAATVVRCLAQAAQCGADPVHVDGAESDLVSSAAHESADNVAVMARAWREALDPDGAQPRDEALRQRRGFVLGRERDGITPFSGACDPMSAAVLRAAFSESNAPDVGPRFLDDTDAALGSETISTPEGEIVTQISDPRTREQRQLDVLVGLVRAGVRSHDQGATAHVTAVIRLDDLIAGTGVGWLDDIDEPVAAESVRELVCDSGFQVLVMGSNGEALTLGRTERFFTRAQRRALAARDGGCVWPGCTAPPSWCDAHHVVEWVQGGPTDVSNGTLLCPAHHHTLHASDFTMKMIDGQPRLLAPPWLDPTREWKLVGRPRLAWTRAPERHFRLVA